MGYEFSGKVVEAYYTDSELKNVSIIYKKGEDTLEYHVTSDPKDGRWLALLEEVSAEQIENFTKAKHEKHRDLFRIAFEDYAARINMPGSHSTEMQIYDAVKKILDFDPSNSALAEDLFKIKLAIFDNVAVKASDNKDIKTNIRRATTPLEALVAYSKL